MIYFSFKTIFYPNNTKDNNLDTNDIYWIY